MIKKKIVNKQIQFFLVPVRFFYRKIARFLFRDVRVFQFERDSIKYLLWANEDIGKRMILQGEYEYDELLAFGALIRQGDICVDIGGNVGIFSLNFARFCGESGIVYVVEPIRKNKLMIELASEINGFKNISVFSYAISDKEGEVVMEVPSVDGAYAFIKPVEVGVPVKNVVRCLSLSNFVDELSIKKIDILKIDVEGAEKLVIDGGVGVFSDRCSAPRVVMVELVDEFLGRYGSSVMDVLLVMRGYGYSSYYATSGGKLASFSDADINKVFNIFFLLSDK